MNILFECYDLEEGFIVELNEKVTISEDDFEIVRIKDNIQTTARCFYCSVGKINTLLSVKEQNKKVKCDFCKQLIILHVIEDE